MADKQSSLTKFFKFAATGVLNTAVDAGVFTLLVYLGSGEYLAQVVGYSCGMLNSYLVNRSWTFKSDAGIMSPTALRFMAANLCLLLLSLGVIYVVHGLLAMPTMVAKGAAICCTLGLGFIVNRRWVFK